MNKCIEDLTPVEVEKEIEILRKRGIKHVELEIYSLLIVRGRRKTADNYGGYFLFRLNELRKELIEEDIKRQNQIDAEYGLQ